MKDATSYCVVAHLHGKLYLLEGDSLHGTGYSPENMTKLAMVASNYKVNIVVMEDNFGDGTVTALFKPVLNSIYPCAIEEVKHSIQKEKRIIDTLEPLMNQHRLIVDKKLVEDDIASYLRGVDLQSYSLFHQMTHITRDRGSLLHDDALDVLAIGVAYWQRILVQDPSQALSMYKSKEKDRQIADFVTRFKRVNGGDNQTKNRYRIMA